MQINQFLFTYILWLQDTCLETKLSLSRLKLLSVVPKSLQGGSNYILKGVERLHNTTIHTTSMQCTEGLVHRLVAMVDFAGNKGQQASSQFFKKP